MNRGGTPQPHPISIVQDRPILTWLRSGDRNLQLLARRTLARDRPSPYDKKEGYRSAGACPPRGWRAGTVLPGLQVL